MNGLAWIGVFSLVLIVLGVAAACLLAKRNDEMQSGGH